MSRPDQEIPARAIFRGALKEKLVKVLVVALIVSGFKSMISLPIENGEAMLRFCVGVLLLAISGYLITFKPGGGKA